MAQSPPTFLAAIPKGPDGIRETLKRMRRACDRGKLDPSMHELANWIVGACEPKDFAGEILSIFDYVQNEIRYSLDPFDVELIKDPAQVVATGTGDCDDFCILLACLLEIKGHPTIFRALGFGRNWLGQPIEEYSHVLVLVQTAGEGGWQSLDATEPCPAGWYPPDVSCTMDML